MLAILSILGALALTTSTTEIGISGNYRSAQNAFYAAERAVEYAMGNPAIVFNNGNTDLNDSTHSARLTLGQSKLLPTATNRVVNLGPGDLPAKMAERYGSDFGANYYVITVTGAQVDSADRPRAQVRIETQTARIFQKDEDSTLMTTGDGG
jgi:Tfp pilus assembly protein PilX